MFVRFRDRIINLKKVLYISKSLQYREIEFQMIDGKKIFFNFDLEETVDKSFQDLATALEEVKL